MPKKNHTLRNMKIVMIGIFTVTFYFGIFTNPDFDIRNFCMSLSSEIIGIAIAVILVEGYIARAGKARAGQRDDENGSEAG